MTRGMRDARANQERVRMRHAMRVIGTLMSVVEIGVAGHGDTGPKALNDMNVRRWLAREFHLAEKRGARWRGNNR